MQINPSALMSLYLARRKELEVKSDQEFVGLCEDAALAEKDGPIHSARLFCGCAACTLLKFEECTMTDFVGKKLRQTTHLAEMQQAQGYRKPLLLKIGPMS